MQPSFLQREESAVASDDAGESPRHGFQGDRGATVSPPVTPCGLTIALSREAGRAAAPSVGASGKNSAGKSSIKSCSSTWPRTA